uniref:Uncharacterized protein n=1 Tax=Panagrolaimus davidi TaxID=227884 RepID=A0A914PLE3_9BILA
MNYSKEMYYSIKDQSGYAGLIYAVLGVFIIGSPLTVYLMMTKLPKNVKGIETFRYLLSSCLISSSSLVVIRAIWVPIPTLPIMEVYSAGIIRHLGPIANLICLNLYVACFVNMQICGTFCLIYQFSALKPFSRISCLGNCPNRAKMCYATYLIVMVTILSIFIHISVVDRSTFYQYALETKNEYITEIINSEPSWIGFSAALKPTIIGFGIFATIPDLCVASLAIFLTTKIWFIMEADKSRVSALTQSLERNLYHTFLIRTSVLVIFYTLPYMGIAATIFFEIQIPKLGIIFHSIISFQVILLLLGTLVMIKPFRVYLFGCCIKKKVHDSSSSNSNGSNTLPTTMTATNTSQSILPPIKIKNFI